MGVTLFDGDSYHGVSVDIWVIHTEVPNLGVTLFDGYSYHGLNAVIGVQHPQWMNIGHSVGSVLGEYWPFTQN